MKNYRLVFAMSMNSWTIRCPCITAANREWVSHFRIISRNYLLEEHSVLTAGIHGESKEAGLHLSRFGGIQQSTIQGTALNDARSEVILQRTLDAGAHRGRPDLDQTFVHARASNFRSADSGNDTSKSCSRCSKRASGHVFAATAREIDESRCLYRAYKKAAKVMEQVI